MAKVFTIAAYVVLGFWLVVLAGISIRHDGLNPQALWFVMGMATISVFGTAILETVKKRDTNLH